jgi:hypothetical protein
MDIVTVLGVVECLGIITDQVEAASLIGLLEDGSGSILGGVYLKGIGTIGVRLEEDWVTQDNLLELLNGGGTARSPGKGRILLRELCQGFGNIGEAPDERPLVAKNTKRATNLLNSGQLFWPGGQAIVFCRVDADHAIIDNDT